MAISQAVVALTMTWLAGSSISARARRDRRASSAKAQRVMWVSSSSLMGAGRVREQVLHQGVVASECGASLATGQGRNSKLTTLPVPRVDSRAPDL